MIEYLLIIAIVLVFAKIFGELCERVGIPSILGELGTGILLGPSMLGLIHDISDPVFLLFAEVGIIMLLFMAGFEHVDIKGMLKYKKASIALNVFGMGIPLVGVFLWGLSMNYHVETSLLLGIALSGTSMGITVTSLLNCNQINSKPGRTLLGALVINDIACLMMMTLVIGVLGSASGNMILSTVYVVLGIGAFFAIFIAAEYILPYVMLYSVRLRVEEAQFTLVFVVVLLAAFLANNFGLSTVIGAFFAGIALSRSSILETETFAQKISSLSYGLFIPIFFILMGAQIDLSNLGESVALALIMLGVVSTLHLGSSFFVHKLFGYTKWEAIFMGLGMIPYGEVTLIVMTGLLGLAGSNPAVFGDPESLKRLFSALLILIALTVMIAPIAMKYVAKKMQSEGRKAHAAV